MQLAVTLIPYVAVGISLIVFLGLFYGISQALQKLRGRIAKLEAHGPQATGLAQGLDDLKRRVQDLEMGAPASENPVHSAAGLNGTIRSKVLKMHRLGQQPQRIADSLRVPKGEVDLLVKVHQIVMRPYEELPAVAGEGEVG